MGTNLGIKAPHNLSLLIPPLSVTKRIAVMGKKLIHDFRGKNPVLLTILKGGREFGGKVSAFAAKGGLIYSSGTVGVSSYKGGTESSREPAISSKLNVDIQGRDVILLDDIVDTGLTMTFLLSHLATYRPKSLSVMTLLHKPSQELVKVPLYDIGFTIDNLYVVGEGLDFDQRYRKMLGVWVVNFH